MPREELQVFSIMGISYDRVLITHTLLQNIMGSTVVALDVARWFVEQGSEVTVFAGAKGLPMIRYFEEMGIRIIIDEKARLHLDDFDLVWVQSQVLPLSIVEELSNMTSPRRSPVFVFNHMSALDLAPDEHPYILGLEDKIASMSVFVSEEARSLLSKYYDGTSGEVQKELLPNVVPSPFLESTSKVDSQRVRKVLMVSNHFPQELHAASGILQANGIDVVTYGKDGQFYELITAEVLSSFDVVVSIGKTVQYCLVMGIPVFIYDHFGGFGYLNDEIMPIAAEANYSGRGGSKLAAEEIAARLVDGYLEARRWHDVKRPQFAIEYSLDLKMQSLLKKIQPREYEGFDERFGAFVFTNEQIALRYYRAWSYQLWVTPRKQKLQEEVNRLEREVSIARRHQVELTSEKERLEGLADSLEAENTTLKEEALESINAQNELKDQVSDLQLKVHDIKESRSWKLGRAMTLPYRKFKRIMKTTASGKQ